MSNHSPAFGILLIGFNRPDFIRDRVEEICALELPRLHIYVSLDYPRDGNLLDLSSHREILEYLRTVRKKHNINIFIEKSNQGCDKHIPSAISRVLQNCQGVLVIEDDIIISPNDIRAILHLAKLNYEKKVTGPIVAMSGVAGNNSINFNMWRKTRYFSAWGYFLFNNFWLLHKEICELDYYSIKKLLDNSSSWINLSRRKRSVWKERFSRANYDYSIQRSVFALNAEVYAPVFRISNNIGFESAKASHTRFPPPIYLRKLVNFPSRTFRLNQIKSPALVRSLLWFDSNTWAGDGLLSQRGRSIGLRTFIKLSFRKIANSINE